MRGESFQVGRHAEGTVQAVAEVEIGGDGGGIDDLLLRQPGGAQGFQVLGVR